MIIPVDIKHRQKMPIGRVIRFVIRKNLKSKLMTPAKRQRMSSGKNGKSIIRKKAYLPFSIFLCILFVFSLPNIQYKIFIPNILPIINAKRLPIITEIVLRIKETNGPKIITPAIVVNAQGSGKKLTCKNCKTIKTM